ncbi:MAG: tetratricopeptide repeat protein [Saprospiraceae bacterium]
MQYQKLNSGKTIIEFHNNWLGEETVIVNGQIVSKKYSILGIHHPFTVMEDGKKIRYVLISKLNGIEVLLDLKRNGKTIHEDVPVRWGTSPQKPKNREKFDGIAKLNAYSLEEALELFEKALDIDPDDPEIHFHMACAYSVLEKPLEAFESLKLAVERGLSHTEAILNHDMLAFVRMNPAFEGFLDSNFTRYDEDLAEKK